MARYDNTKAELLMLHAEKRGISLSWNDANLLRRAALTLHRWAERECGDSNDYASFAIERDETTGVPYSVVYPHTSNEPRRTKIADREKGALKRIAALAKVRGFHFYHQGDPRGCALYISATPIAETDYTNGLAVGA